MCNEIKGSYDKIITTIVPSYTGKNITHLLPLALLLMLHTRNNTDGYKLVIFSGIALYYGDTCIVSPTCIVLFTSVSLVEFEFVWTLQRGKRTFSFSHTSKLSRVVI